MNSTFKVVFNKARGALMVVNEVTSSVQAKGTKTVVATAVAAMIAGTAAAAAAATTTGPSDTDKVILDDAFNATTLAITDAENGTPTTVKNVFTVKKGGSVTGADQSLVISATNATNAGTIGTSTDALKEIQYLSDFTNTKDGKIYADTVTVGKTGSVNNSGWIEADVVSVYGKVETGILSKDNGHLWFKEALNLEDGGYVNIKEFLTDEDHAAAYKTAATTAYNTAHELTSTDAGYLTEIPADTLVFMSGEINFNGGTFALKGKSEGLNVIAMGNDASNKAINFNKGTYAFGNVDVYGNNQITVGASDAGTKTNEDLHVSANNLFLKNTGTNTIQDGYVTIGTLDALAAVVIKGTANVDVTKANIGAAVTVSGKAAVTAGEVAVDAGASLAVGGASADLTTVVLTKSDTENGGGKLAVTAGETTIGTLTVNKNAVAELAADEEGFVDIMTLTNEGSVAVKGGDVAVETLTNNATVSVDNEKTLEVGALNNAKAASKVSLATAAVLTLNGESTNAGTIGGDSDAAGVLNVAGSLKNSNKVNVVTANVKGSVTNVKDFNATTLNVAGVFDNTSEKVENVESKGKITATTVNVLKGGVLKTAADETNVYAVATTNVEEGATLSFAKLNTKVGEVETENALTLTKNYTIDGTLAIGETAFAGDLIVNTGTVTFGNEQTLGNLTLASGGKIVVDEGTVKVTGKLTNAAAADISVNAFSTLELAVNTTTVTELNGAVTASPLDGKEITNNGTIVFTGKALTFADAGAVQTFVGHVQTGNGLIKFADGVTLTTSPVDVTGDNAGKISATNANKLAGVEIDDLKTKTVYDVEAAGLAGGSFGDVLLKTGITTLTVAGGLTLNGANGNLVTYMDTDEDGEPVAKLGGAQIAEGKVLTTTGAGAKIGAITEATSGKSALTVASGDLTISGDSKVGELVIVEGAEVAMAKATATSTAVAKLEAVEMVVGGTLTAGELKLTGTDSAEQESLIIGTVTADKLDAAGTVYVGSDEDGYSYAGKLTVKDLASGTIFADPAWKDGDQLALGEASLVAVGTMATASTVIAGQGAIVAVGTTDADAAVKAVADAGYTVLGANEGQVKSAVYVEMAAAEVDPVSGVAGAQTPIDGNIIANGWTSEQYDEALTASTNVEIAEGNLMVINMATVEEGSTIFKKAVKNEGVLYLANVNLGDEFKLSEQDSTIYTAATATEAQKGEVLFNGDRLMSVVGATNGAVTAAGTLTIDWDADKVADYEDLETLDLVMAMYEEKAQNGTSKSAQFNNWLMSSTNGLDADDVVQAGNDVASIVGTAGMANVTMDALSQFNDTVAVRTSVLAKNGEGVNVWVDVNGGKFEGKKVMDGQGYSSDIYAGVLGVDTTVACGAKIGAALTIGTADTDSQNTTAKTSMDSDLFGISIYTAKQFGDFNVAADIGYMQASNDVNVQAYNLGDFSADSDAFTIGLRGEVLAKAGSLDIVPHAGIRWTRLSIDNFEAGYTTDIKSMNVFQMPVGVTISGEIEASGWTIAPAFDLTFVPTWGDKDIEATLGIGGVSLKEEDTMRVLDSNLVQATFGVAAQNGAWTFGLDYKLGVGSDDRMNNSFNARVNYAF